MPSALYFEDLQIGQAWDSPRRTVTQSDVVIFAGMTGDYDRLHVDHDFAENSRFGQVLAHGIMGLAWAAGLSSTAPAVSTMALVAVNSWRFLLPVVVGDTLWVQTEVLALEKGGRSAGRVIWRKSVKNQRNETVQSGDFTSLVELASRVPRSHLPSPASNSSSNSAKPAAMSQAKPSQQAIKAATGTGPS